MKNRDNKINLFHLALIFICWMVIDYGFGYCIKFLGLPRKGDWTWIWAAVRMTLLGVVTYLYIKLYEKKSFKTGFNFSFSKFGLNLLWAFVFFLIASAILLPYYLFIVQPLLHKSAEASSVSGDAAATVNPFIHRLIEYIYVVFEGFIEVLIFIGFLVDRLVKRLNWWSGVLIANIGFALWHYSYWSKGFLEGTLMIILTLLLGTIHSLNYLKTKNSLSPAFCHFFTDSPTAIHELLGIIH